jgi:ribonucleoside-diphosphate reductase beta chain
MTREHRPDADPTGDEIVAVRTLIRRWEAQPWAASSIDLEPDRRAWPRIPVALRAELAATISEVGGGDLAVTELLIPLIEAAPDQEWAFYLTTQLSDEAKHAMFFQRYAEEVVSDVVAPDGAEPLTFAESSYRTVFEPVLRAAVDPLRGEHGPGDWYRASTLYHLVTEGVLGVSVLRIGRAMTGSRRLVPGLAEGIAGVFRDESRHIAFGRRAAQTGMADGHGTTIAEAYLDGVRAAAAVMVGADRAELALADPRLLAQRGRTKTERLSEALRRATRQALRLGLPLDGADIARAWCGGRDAATDDYLDRWGAPHSSVGHVAVEREREAVR